MADFARRIVRAESPAYHTLMHRYGQQPSNTREIRLRLIEVRFRESKRLLEVAASLIVAFSITRFPPSRRGFSVRNG